MDNLIGKSSSSTKITSDQTFEPDITSHPSSPPTAQSSYSAKIITPADSLILTAAESFPRGGSSGLQGGSNFGERVSHLGSSISHMISDLTHAISERAHETLDMISDTAHHLSDAVTHADYQSMVEGTRREICSHPKRDLAVAAGVGIALGLLASSRRSRH